MVNELKYSRKLRASVLAFALIAGTLGGCSVNTRGAIETTCAQGRFAPIYPTEHDWAVISPYLFQDILDHNMNFE